MSHCWVIFQTFGKQWISSYDDEYTVIGFLVQTWIINMGITCQDVKDRGKWTLINKIENNISSSLYYIKLYGVGPVDNRPYSN